MTTEPDRTPPLELPLGTHGGCMFPIFMLAIVTVVVGGSGAGRDPTLLVPVGVVLALLAVMARIVGFEPGAAFLLDPRVRQVGRRGGWGSTDVMVVARFDEIARVRLYNTVGWRIHIRLERVDGGHIVASDVGGPRSRNVGVLRDRARAAAQVLGVPFEDDTRAWSYGR